jgi:glutamate synthase (NADPH/NADH) small chain
MAIVGAGPAGLAAAEELAKLGHPVTVFDNWPRPGGNLRYGIPSFKLAKHVVDAKISQLEALGVQFTPATRLGENLDLAGVLERGFVAVFLAYGASQGNRLDVPGEELTGVYAATDFLVRANLETSDLPDGQQGRIDVGQRVVVIGGGDTAMDCVRSALRLGAREVTCAYRRSEREMPGRTEERGYARDEGAQIVFLAAPRRIVGNGRVSAIELVRMELSEPDGSGRASVRPIDGSEFTLPADTVVVAAGYQVEAEPAQALPGVVLGRGGVVAVEHPSCRTSVPGVFAGGDLTTGPSLVVTAVAAGRRAAQEMHEYGAQAKPAPAARPPRPHHQLDLATLSLWRTDLVAEAERIRQSGPILDAPAEHRLQQVEFELELIEERIREAAGGND